MRKKKFVKSTIIFLLLAIIIVVFFLSPLFSINKIVVLGTSHYSEDEIANLFEDLVGKNGFCVVLEESNFSHLGDFFRLELSGRDKKLIFEKPYIKSATISYSFPNTLFVEILERNPAFLTKHEGVYLLVDSEGFVLETFTEDNRPDYPILQGLDINSFKIGTSLESSSSEERLLLSIQICNLMQQTNMLSGYINIIDIENMDEIWMAAFPSLSIKLGDRDDLGLKISKLKAIMDNGYNGNSEGVIDFTSSKNPIFQANAKPTETPENDIDVIDEGQSFE